MEIMENGEGSGAKIKTNLKEIRYFSNLKYKIDNTLKFTPVAEIEQHPGIIKNWQISQPFPFSQVDLEKHPDEQELGDIKWQEVIPEPNGLVDISRYYGRTEREYDCILAKATIHSDQEKVMQLQFGYSDLITLSRCFPMTSPSTRGEICMSPIPETAPSIISSTANLRNG